MLISRLSCVVPFIFTAFASSASCQSAPSLQQRIQSVETGLAPAVVITGQPPVHHVLLDEMTNLHVPAVSIAVIHGGVIEWAKGYGVTRASGPPTTPDTLFQAASISKSLAAMAALHLVEQGKLTLDAPIQTELKSWTLPQNSFTAQKTVTLRELLSHTAGTSVHGFAGYAAGDPVPTLVQVLNGVKPANSAPIVVEIAPGTEFRYSGGGFTIAQQAMIDATGEPFPTIMKTLVLDPIGLHNSSYQQPIAPEKLSMVAMPVDSTGKPIPGGPHTYPEMAAAGLWTTPSDLARWIIEMQQSLNGKANHVLSAAMTRTMLTPVKEGYALGVGTQNTGGKPSFGHSGSNEGYQCQYVGYENGDGAVVMTNSDSGGQLINEVLRSIAQVYGWPDFAPQQRTLAVVPLAEQLQFAGKFQLKDAFPFEITAEGGTLQLSIAGQPPRPLLTSSPTTFFVTDGPLQMTFDTPDKGVASFSQQKIPFERLKVEQPKP
jgi:CubicO group peptidase (beta-lactamase class C family)